MMLMMMIPFLLLLLPDGTEVVAKLATDENPKKKKDLIGPHTKSFNPNVALTDTSTRNPKIIRQIPPNWNGSERRRDFLAWGGRRCSSSQEESKSNTV
jgi:hypothetical protein